LSENTVGTIEDLYSSKVKVTLDISLMDILFWE